MITLTRLHGQRFALNPDLIERVESTPDTVVTLVDGSRYVVTEALETVIDLVRHFRASVIALSHRLEFTASGDGARDAAVLHLVPERGGD